MPGQKVGVGRTRVLLSNDDMQGLSAIPAKFKKDNYLKEELEDESDGMVQLGGPVTKNGKDEEGDKVEQQTQHRINSDVDVILN